MNDPSTFFWTVASAVTIFVLGQIYLKGFVEPLLDLRKEIGQTAYILEFYWNRMFAEGAEGEELRKKIRDNACDLYRKSQTPIVYSSCRFLFGMPAREDIHKASRRLIGLSNQVGERTPEDPKIKRKEEIYKLLKIENFEEK
ncbi:hypothetical protein [Pelagicoccus sp. SDUM812003]|uniref:hypothetical protein n=1 Tax=Pelagicoccus sp. SDUM812003 TaxID=3041267 RepID=UPI00280CDC2D|nr:hypothetical protein [Pelagicoccus sp. SDUM812003]MDQ8205841.1 hypothetical protein [Pelagicoccus sp. SDUM812003]